MIDFKFVLWLFYQNDFSAKTCLIFSCCFRANFDGYLKREKITNSKGGWFTANMIIVNQNLFPRRMSKAKISHVMDHVSVFRHYTHTHRAF